MYSYAFSFYEFSPELRSIARVAKKEAEPEASSANSRARKKISVLEYMEKRRKNQIDEAKQKGAVPRSKILETDKAMFEDAQEQLEIHCEKLNRMLDTAVAPNRLRIIAMGLEKQKPAIAEREKEESDAQKLEELLELFEQDRAKLKKQALVCNSLLKNLLSISNGIDIGAHVFSK